eukprot:Gb_22330 [translate_table: standard]
MKPCVERPFTVIYWIMVHCFVIASYCSASINGDKCQSSCGNISLSHPFGQQGCGAFPYAQMLRCEDSDHGNGNGNGDGKTLQLRTAWGPFEVKEVDYASKSITILDPSMSTCSNLRPIGQQHFAVDSILPPAPDNTIVLLNCANTSSVTLNASKICNNNFSIACDDLYKCSAFEGLRERVRSSSAMACCATDFQTLGNRSLKELQCSHYTSVHGGKSGANNLMNPKEWPYGIRLSFLEPNDDEIPDVGSFCEKCDRPFDIFDPYDQDHHDNCGIGRRCICFPHECEDDVFSRAAPHTLAPTTIKMAMLLSISFAGLNMWKIL